MCSAIWKVIRSYATCPPGLESCVTHNHLWLIWHCLWGFPSPNWPWVLLESNKLWWKDVQLVYMKKETGSQSNEETWVIWSCNCGWRESSRLRLPPLPLCQMGTLEASLQATGCIAGTNAVQGQSTVQCTVWMPQWQVSLGDSQLFPYTWRFWNVMFR